MKITILLIINIIDNIINEQNMIEIKNIFEIIKLKLIENIYNDYTLELKCICGIHEKIPYIFKNVFYSYINDINNNDNNYIIISIIIKDFSNKNREGSIIIRNIYSNTSKDDYELFDNVYTLKMLIFLNK